MLLVSYTSVQRIGKYRPWDEGVLGMVVDL